MLTGQRKLEFWPEGHDSAVCIWGLGLGSPWRCWNGLRFDVTTISQFVKARWRWIPWGNGIPRQLFGYILYASWVTPPCSQGMEERIVL